MHPDGFLTVHLTTRREAAVINNVLLVGKVADLKVTWDADGKPQTSFTLLYTQSYGEGKVAKLFIPVDVAPSSGRAGLTGKAARSKASSPCSPGRYQW